MNDMDPKTKKIICIGIMVIIFIVFVIITKILPDNSSTKSTLPTASSVSEKTEDPSSMMTESPEEQISQYTVDEKIRVLKKDAVRFLNAYTTLTNGTYESQKEYYDRLTPMMTEKAIDEYLNLDTLQSPDSFNKTIYETNKLTNKKILIYYELINSNSNKANVYMDCIQVVKYRTGSTEYPYHFVGKFVYSKETNTWKCDRIEKATSYTDS